MTSAQITCYSTNIQQPYLSLIEENIADQYVDLIDISSQRIKMNNEHMHLITQTKPQSKCISVVNIHIQFTTWKW